MLTTRAAGLFIWAETLTSFLEQDSPHERLHFVLAADLGEGGTGIDNLYQNILKFCFRNSTGSNLEAFHAVLGAIIFAKVPLHRGDLSYLIHPRKAESEIDSILNNLSPIILMGSFDHLLRISHLSFAEFLCDPRRCPEPFVMDRSAQCRNLAVGCLRIMNEELESNIDAFAASLLDNDDIGDLTAHTKFGACVLYSNSFWVEHFQESMDANLEQDAFLKEVEDFLRIHFSHWQNVPRLIGEVSLSSQSFFDVPADVRKA